MVILIPLYSDGLWDPVIWIAPSVPRRCSAHKSKGRGHRSQADHVNPGADQTLHQALGQIRGMGSVVLAHHHP